MDAKSRSSPTWPSSRYLLIAWQCLSSSPLLCSTAISRASTHRPAEPITRSNTGSCRHMIFSIDGCRDPDMCRGMATKTCSACLGPHALAKDKYHKRDQRRGLRRVRTTTWFVQLMHINIQNSTIVSCAVLRQLRSSCIHMQTCFQTCGGVTALAY